jgi:hypothetical protein
VNRRRRLRVKDTLSSSSGFNSDSSSDSDSAIDYKSLFISDRGELLRRVRKIDREKKSRKSKKRSKERSEKPRKKRSEKPKAEIRKDAHRDSLDKKMKIVIS